MTFMSSFDHEGILTGMGALYGPLGPSGGLEALMTQRKVVDARERFLARRRRPPGPRKKPKPRKYDSAQQRDPLEVMSEEELKELDEFIESQLPPKAEVRFLPWAEYEEISFEEPPEPGGG